MLIKLLTTFIVPKGLTEFVSMKSLMLFYTVQLSNELHFGLKIN